MTKIEIHRLCTECLDGLQILLWVTTNFYRFIHCFTRVFYLFFV